MKKFIYFITGCLCSFILMSSTSIFAETINKIDVVFDRVKLVVNGTTIDNQTLLYNGVTYVPMREVATLLGKDIAYDKKTTTAFIDEKGVDRQAKIDKIQAAGKSLTYYYSWDTVPKLDEYADIEGETIEGGNGGTGFAYIIYGYKKSDINADVINSYADLMISQGFTTIDYLQYNKSENRNIRGAFKKDNVQVVLESGNAVMGMGFYVTIVDLDNLKSISTDEYNNDAFHLRTHFVKFGK